MSKFKTGDIVRLVGLHPEDSRYIDRVEYEGYLYEVGLACDVLKLIPTEKYGLSAMRRDAIMHIGNIISCYLPNLQKV